MGQDVRILSSIAGGKPDYPLPIMTIPIFKNIIAKEGFHFAKPKKEIIKEAIRWADLVHLEDPFPVCWSAAKIAKQLRKPITGTFHLYPENLTASVPILDHGSINSAFMRLFCDTTFYYCSYLQCPTTKVEQRLKKYNFKSKLIAISNGISDYYLQNNQRTISTDSFTILSICQRLKINAQLGFYSRNALKQIMDQSNIAIHCTNVEVEGMACMEAFATGCVPIIAQSPISSTSSYALSPNNLFPAGRSEILSQRIDYWINHPQDLKMMSTNYQNYAKSLTVQFSAKKILTMIKNAQKNYLSN